MRPSNDKCGSIQLSGCPNGGNLEKLQEACSEMEMSTGEFPMRKIDIFALGAKWQNLDYSSGKGVMNKEFLWVDLSRGRHAWNSQVWF